MIGTMCLAIRYIGNETGRSASLNASGIACQQG
jgi:hypothetical protein